MMISTGFRSMLCVLIHASLAGVLGAQEIAEPVAFPLEVRAGGGELQELELRLVDGRVDGLAELDRLVFRDVILPGGSALDIELEAVDLERMQIGVHLNGQPQAELVEPLGLSVWQGTVLGSEDSEVSLSFSRFGCHGWVRDGDRLVHMFSEAHPTEGWANARTRWTTDALLRERRGEVGVLCAMDALEEQTGTQRAPVLRDPEASSTSQSMLLGSETYVAAIAVETDYQYFQVFGDTNAALSYVVSLFAWASNRFETQVGTVLTLPYVNFYTTAADPWIAPDTGGNCLDMIYEFQAAWIGNVPMGADIGHMLSGANLGCGAGFIGGLCDPARQFSVSGNGNGMVTFPVMPSDANLDFYAVGHELGHNFSAPHTHDYCPPIDECATAGYFGQCQTQQACTYPGTLMSYCHVCGGFSNISTWFHPQSALDMRNHVETSGCLPVYCPPPVAYCSSQYNSDGCAPEIDFSGSPSLSGADDFHIKAALIVANKSGLLFYGFGPANIPLLGGTLCVQGPQVRTSIANSGGSSQFPCDGEFDFFWSQAFNASQGIGAGTSVYAQFWYRDPGAASGTGLTDALEFSVCP